MLRTSEPRRTRAGRKATAALLVGAFIAVSGCSSSAVKTSTGTTVAAAATAGAAPNTTAASTAAGTIRAATTPGSAAPAGTGTAAASGSAQAVTLAPPEGGTPKTGGTYRFLGLTEPASFDNAKVVGQPFNDGDVPYVLYDNLVEFDAKGQMVPRLASAVTPDSTFTVWTITLRKGVVFSDGTPFNAAAVKATWDRMADPATASPCLPTVSLGAYAVVDDLTITVTLKKPDSTWPIVLVSCAGMIGSPTAFQKDPQGFGTHPIGAGPFVLKTWTPGVQAVFIKNPTYWDAPKPYLDSVVIRWLGNPTQRYQSFNANEADAVLFITPVTEVKELLDAKVKYVKPALVGATAQVFNVTAPGLDDVRVRRALALATDPADIIAKTAAGAIDASNAFFPTGSAFASADQPLQKVNDLAAGQALIDQYVAEKGPVTVNLISSPVTKSAIETLQQQWSRLKGVTVNLKVLDNPIPQMVSGDFGSTSIAAAGRDPELLKRFTTGFASNFGKYSNPQVDALILQGRQTTDLVARQKIYNQVLSILFNDAAFILLIPSAQYTFLKNNVHLVQYGDGMWDFSSIWMG